MMQKIPGMGTQNGGIQLKFEGMKISHPKRTTTLDKGVNLIVSTDSLQN